MRRLLVVTMLIIASNVVRGADESPPLDPSHVRSGRVIYKQYCASCHGVRGEGAPNWQERDERGELPAPPQNSEGHTWRHSDAELYEMVSKGWRDPFNQTNRLTMPAFRDLLSPEQILAVNTYLKTLWTRQQRQFQSEENKDRKTSPTEQ